MYSDHSRHASVVNVAEKPDFCKKFRTNVLSALQQSPVHIRKTSVSCPPLGSFMCPFLFLSSFLGRSNIV